MTDVSEPLAATLLGVATPYPRPGRACSGYLLAAEGRRVWVDAGPGTLANLQRHVSLPELNAIWLSHLHADHCADLLTTYYALAHADLAPRRRIPVYGPPGWADRIEAFLAGRPGFPDLERVFVVHELYDGHRADLGGLEITSREVVHDVPSFGLRAASAGRVFAYSGDTGPCPALVELASGADLFLCEAGSPDEGRGSGWHCTPEQAGAAARSAAVGRLLVTHVSPGLPPKVAASRAARQEETPPVVAAYEGDTYSVGPLGVV